ncbi:hypothetical protein [Terribacillus saccharophilus]|uniref:Uncharacterized protein n=1 Tax=Terribacillus saccharophilus TaxID=361277 RepID=A0AAX2EJ26_9BACI|nr:MULTISPECIES: hypothetical protein [Terribacillus]MCM3226136.1 hypothetical protein [Terribacillus saccharophilus]SEN95127.1 hypothetical protein SAMN04489762_3171 [Terribacillus saccharophilus]
MPQFTFSVTEQLIPNQDYTDKKKQLRTHVDNMRADDDEFYVLVNNIIVGEDQKGKIIDAMKKETTARKDHDESIYADVISKISKSVNSFNEQVADMKKQRLSITYEDKTE